MAEAGNRCAISRRTGVCAVSPPPAGKGNLFNEVIRSSENPGLVLIETLANTTLMMRQIRHALQQLKV
jgi:hypothetical protein